MNLHTHYNDQVGRSTYKNFIHEPLLPLLQGCCPCEAEELRDQLAQQMREVFMRTKNILKNLVQILLH